MSDDFEAQVEAIEAANAHEGDKMEPGAGEAAAKPEAESKEPQAKAPLELTDGDEAVDLEDGEEGGEEDASDKDESGPKRRSKPASQRIAELTAKLRAAERELESARNPEPQEAAKEPPAKPDASTFEYGEADPAYIDAMVDWKLETREAARDAERSKTDDAQREQTAFRNRIEAGVAKAQAEAQEKYDDFDAKITEAVEARGGEPLPPMLSIAVGVSPAGGDILYRLATDPDVSERLETLARGGHATAPKMAMALGELEGEYLADGDDSDLDMSDQLDMARMMGRMRARLAGKQAPAKETIKDIPETRAPEPPEKRARGGAGSGRTTPDTDDMKAFMKEYGSGLGT